MASLCATLISFSTLATRATFASLTLAFATAASSFFFFSAVTSAVLLRGLGRSTRPGALVVLVSRGGGRMLVIG